MERAGPIASLAYFHSLLDRDIAEVRTPSGLAAVIGRGIRRPDVTEALESIASDLAIPSGALETLSSTGEITRARALLARVDLGVGPTSVERLIEIARANDPGVAAVALAAIDPDLRGAARRLLALLPCTDTSGARLGGFFVRTLVLTAIERVLSRSRDAHLHDEVADALSLWVREAGLAASGARALPPDVLVTMLARVASLDSARWPPSLATIVGDAEVSERALDAHWLGPRCLRPSASHASCVTFPALLEARAPIDAFAEVDELLLRAPRGTHAVPSWAIYDVVRATAHGLGLAEWSVTLRWPPSAIAAVVDAIDECEIAGNVARDAMDELLAGPREVIDTIRSPIVALARHDRSRWLTYVESVATDLSVRTRASAARLVATALEGPRASEILEGLALDPSQLVRQAARSAQIALRVDADERHAARLLLLAAARGEHRTSRVTRVTRSLTNAALVRRARRTARRIGLSPAAIAFVDESLPLRIETMIGTARSVSARLVATDGHRVDTAVLVEQESDSDRFAFARPLEMELFVKSAPSSFFRVEREGHPDRAVQVRRDLDVRPADMRLLGLVL